MTAIPDLANRTVIVTGGAGLLGREYARALVDVGANVVLGDVDSAVYRVASELEGGTGAAVGVCVDVSDEASVARMVAAAMDCFGRIDGLVNNAAIDPKFDASRSRDLLTAFENYPLDLWNHALAVNLTGMFLCAKAVAPMMLSQKRGVIINVSSTYGLVSPDQRLYEKDDAAAPREFKPVTYAVTKSAVLGLTRYLATYWGSAGIRVNTLSPGGVRNQQPDEFVRRYDARTPMGRMADRTEYCGALLFLLSDASSYMTGSNLVVDGGWTAW